MIEVFKVYVKEDSVVIVNNCYPTSGSSSFGVLAGIYLKNNLNFLRNQPRNFLETESLNLTVIILLTQF